MLPRFLRLNAPVAIALTLVAHALFVAGSQPADAVPASYTSTATGSTPSQRRVASGWTGDSRTGTFSLEDFEGAAFDSGGVSPGPLGVEGINSSINSGNVAGGSFTPNPVNVYTAGQISDGFSIDNLAPGVATDDFFAVDNGIAPNFGGSTVTVSAGGRFGGEGDTMTITFPADRNVTAVGFDLFTWIDNLTRVSRTVTVQAFAGPGQTNAIFGTAPTIVSSTAGFVFLGIAADNPILSIQISGDPGLLTSHEGLDNLVFNPEPSTFALTALGMLGMVGFVRRRKRAARASA